MQIDFTTVTELSGDEVSQEQVERLAHRYYWAAEYCRGRDVLEVACGAGQGLGFIASVAKSVRGGDITPALVQRAQEHYGKRIELSEMDAQVLPFGDQSLDVVILFETLYYLPSPEQFVAECRRVLRPRGVVLIATANKDLYDFSPSPFSHRYLGVVELSTLFRAQRFQCEFFGNLPVQSVSLRQRVLRPIKAIVVRFNLMPKTMAAKKFLKRLVFGRLVPMPAEITADTATYSAPVRLSPDQPDRGFKVIYLAASLPS
jgi:ubiquinone/menaquinone biosynthesis C-methylase UbiE